MAVSSGLCFFSPPTAPFPVTFPSSRICRPALVNGRFPSSSMSQLFDSKLSVMIRTQTTPTHSWGPQLTVCKVHPGGPPPQFKLPGCMNDKEVIDSSKYIGKCTLVVFCCPDDNSDKTLRNYFSNILEMCNDSIRVIAIASPKDCPNRVKDFVEKHVVPPPPPGFLSIASDNNEEKVRKQYGVLCAFINKEGIVEYTLEGEREGDVKDALKS